MDSRYSPVVLCPLCGDEHETKIARNGRPYFNCELWMNRLFGNSQVSLAIFGNNGGPVPAPQPRRRGRANPGAIPDSIEVGEIEVPDRRNEDREPQIGTCGGCGSTVTDERPDCWKCGERLNWGNPQGDTGDAEDEGEQPCPGCGKPVPYHSARCPHCGFEVEWEPG